MLAQIDLAKVCSAAVTWRNQLKQTINAASLWETGCSGGRYRTLSNRREATGSVVTEPVYASASERRGQFCSQRSEYCRSRDRNLSGSGGRAIVFEFHLGYVIAMPTPSARL